MKNNRITIAIFVVSFLLVGSATTALSGSTYFIPLGDDDTPFTYNDIPFEQWGASLEVYKTDFGFVPTQSIDLSGYITEKIHIIEAAAWATNVPDGVVVGHINVHYADGSSETLDLVVGVNIAEWAYDRTENQPYLNHTKVPPAYSYWTDIDSAYFYWGHNFYVQITTQEKPLDNLELILDPTSYTGQPDTGMGLADWFGISINAITLQVSGESPEGMLSGLALFIMDEVDSGNIDPELEGSLLVKMNAAISAMEKDNPNAATVAMNNLKALINHVEAQIGKKITPEAAAQIIQQANTIIAILAG